MELLIAAFCWMLFLIPSGLFLVQNTLLTDTITFLEESIINRIMILILKSVGYSTMRKLVGWQIRAAI